MINGICPYPIVRPLTGFRSIWPIAPSVTCQERRDSCTACRPRTIDLSCWARCLMPHDVVQANPEECLAAEGAKAPRGVFKRYAQRDTGPQIAAAGQDLSGPWPVDDLATLDPARTQHQVRVRGRVEQWRQLLWLVGTVGVHLDEDVVVVVDSPLEAGQVRCAKTLLSQTVHDVDLVIGRCQGVSQLAGPIRRVVVSDQDVGVRNRLAGTGDDPVDVLRLVVGRDDDQGSLPGVGPRLAHVSPFLYRLAVTGALAVSLSGEMSGPSWRTACRRREPSPVALATARTQQSSPAAASSPSIHGASRMAGVICERSGMATTVEAAVNSSVLKAVLPWASMRPETLLVVATAISRRVSMALARVIANCCSI